MDKNTAQWLLELVRSIQVQAAAPDALEQVRQAQKAIHELTAVIREQ